MDAIPAALEQYLSSAVPRLQAAYAMDLQLGGGLRLGNLRMAIAAEEQSGQFHNLGNVCLANITAPRGRLSSSSVTEETWGRALGAFLRNTGAYQSIARSEHVAPCRLARRLAKEAARAEHIVTYHALLEGIALDADVAWADCRLVHVNPSSLEDLLGLQTRSLFFDDDLADVHRLARHWFLVASERVATGIRGALQRVHPHWSNRLSAYPSDFSQPVEDALATLALYDWQPEWAEDDHAVEVRKQLGWLGFRVPLVLEIGSDLLASPRHVPDTSQVAMESVPGPTGGEIGEWPARPFLELDAAQTQDLRAFLPEMQALRDGLPCSSSADFLRVANDALLKALLSGGMGQLLWHIVAIEAVLGEPRAGQSTKLLACRVGSVLATAVADRETISEGFEELYGFRSDLVHGRRPKKSIFRGHLRKARALALPIVVWALRTFAKLQTQSATGAGRAPRRKDLLRLADLP